MDWTPTIADRQGPLYQRILHALADDIASGRLHHGQMLPTHRALARALGVDLTTVTRAYAEARRQGLTEARVGRGTFVRAPTTRGPRAAVSPGVDLSMNLPPQPSDARLDARLAEALTELRAGPGVGAYLTYQQLGGTRAERQIAAEWLAERRSLISLGADRVIVAPGTQPVLYALLAGLVRPAGTLLVERLTYPGIKAAAEAVGVRLVGVEMDSEGMLPSALDRAARAAAATAVYLMPTLHNPTTATMSAERRGRIAAVIRRRGLTLIEDDPYAFLAPGPPPVGSWIPERAYLVASLSKAIAPGLRTSLVVAPDAAAATRLASALRGMLQMPAPLMTAVVTRWMQSGAADAIVAAVRREAEARQLLARAALGAHPHAAHPSGLHVWLPLPSHRPAARFARDLEGRGLAVVTGEAFASDETAPNAIRLALGAARSRAQLAKALQIVSETLRMAPPDAPAPS